LVKQLVRHFPAAEINELRAEFLVRGKKRGAFQYEIILTMDLEQFL
jgi:hypothetical protein